METNKARRGKLFQHLMKYPHHDLKIEPGKDRGDRAWIVDLWMENPFAQEHVVDSFARARDAKRALVRLGYVQEGQAWRSTPKRVQLPLWEPKAVEEARHET